MAIEEGDTVITPEGRIGEVDSMIRDGKLLRVEVNEVGFQDDLLKNLIKANAPLRVKITSEPDAEALLGHSEEAGFNMRYDKQLGGWPKVIALDPDKMAETFTARKGHDLTYPSDSDQVLAYLEYHADDESGVDCERCGDTGKVYGSGDSLEPTLDCPDCTDTEDEELTTPVNDDDERWIKSESEDYDEPRVEGEVDADFVKNILWELCDITSRRSVGEYGDIIDSIVQKFRELENELEDCWKNQQEYKNNVAELHRRVYNLQNRIEEAMERVEEARNTEGIKTILEQTAEDLLEILQGEGGDSN